MTLDEIEQLARTHEDGHDGERYAECRRCNTTMETEPDDDPTAFCASCVYGVADEFARFVLVVLPVARAAAECESSEYDRSSLQVLDAAVGAMIESLALGAP